MQLLPYFKNMTSIFAIFGLFCLFTIAQSLPSNLKSDETESLDGERRATWLETRESEENFKELVYLSIQELASEGLLNSKIFATENLSEEKRGRHQGFCFKKTKSGRFLPYICWKGDDESEEK